MISLCGEPRQITQLCVCGCVCVCVCVGLSPLTMRDLKENANRRTPGVALTRRGCAGGGQTTKKFLFE